MNRNNPLSARLALAALLFVLLIGGGAASRAQGFDACPPCDHISIRIDKAVACAVTICWTISPDGLTKCEPIKPERTIDIPCFKGQQVLIRLCDGTYFDLAKVGGDCVGLHVGTGCCVKVCPAIGICRSYTIAPSDGACIDIVCK